MYVPSALYSVHHKLLQSMSEEFADVKFLRIDTDKDPVSHEIYITMYVL